MDVLGLHILKWCLQCIDAVLFSPTVSSRSAIGGVVLLSTARSVDDGQKRNMATAHSRRACLYSRGSCDQVQTGKCVCCWTVTSVLHWPFLVDTAVNI